MGQTTRQKGCWFYGCLVLAVAGLLVITLGVTGYYVTKRAINKWVTDYTETSPALLEKVEADPARLELLRGQLASFGAALEKRTNAFELPLRTEDLNLLIVEDEQWHNKLRVRVGDSNIQANVSIPLSDVGPLKLNGRFLNGQATLRALLANGVLDVRLDEVMVKNKHLPELLLKELKQKNLAEDFARNPEMAARMANLESLRITNGTVLLKSRGPGR